MLTITATITRPNTSVAWWSDTTAPEVGIYKSLLDDQLVVSYSEVVSPDGLSVIKTAVYNSYDDYYTWIGKIKEADSLLLAKRNDYIVEHNMTLKIEENDGSANVVEKIL